MARGDTEDDDRWSSSRQRGSASSCVALTHAGTPYADGGAISRPREGVGDPAEVILWTHPSPTERLAAGALETHSNPRRGTTRSRGCVVERVAFPPPTSATTPSYSPEVASRPDILMVGRLRPNVELMTKPERLGVVGAAGSSIVFGAWMAFDPAGALVSRWIADFVLAAISLVSAVPLFRAAQRASGATARAWRYFGISSVAWAFGQLCFALQQNVFDHGLPVGSIPDVGFLASTVTALAGAASLASGSRLSKLRVAVDGAIASLALLGLSWIFVLDRSLASENLTSVATVTSTVYKVSDVVLLALLVAVMAASPKSNRMPLVWLVTGKLLHGVTNAIYTVMVANGTYRSGDVLDVGWFAAFAAVLVAGRAANHRPTTWRTFGRPQPRTLVPHVPVVVGAIWIIWSLASGTAVESRVIALGAVTALLMVPRQWMAINEHASSHRRLEEAQRAARIGSWEMEPRTGTMYWSDQVFELLALDPTSVEPSFEAFLDRVHPNDRTDARSTVDEATLAGPGTSVFELQLELQDGAVRWARVTMVGVDARGERLRGTLQDITETKTAELAMHQAQKLEAVGRLASGIAHDFNNLLTPIIMHADLLGRRAPQNASSAAAITAAAGRAADLTQQLLAFCRGQNSHRTPVDATAVMAEVARLIEPSVPEDVVVNVRASTSACVIDGDAAQLHQVVMNLIVNAVDAMPGGGVLGLSTATVDVARSGTVTVGRVPVGEAVALTVTDTGAGMDAPTAARCFEPFFTTKAMGKGTGLGLATVYGIVTAAGGGIQIESRPGAGTSVTVLLPRSETVTTPATARASSASARPATIVVVDDDAAIAAAVGDLLRSAGHDVVGFSDSRRALEAATELPTVDLLVTDVLMPHLGGFDLAGELRARRPEVPVLFMSGFQEHGVPDDLGGSRSQVLAKPFLPSQLEEAVTLALAGS